VIAVALLLLVSGPAAAQPALPGSPETGEALFTGKVRFTNGGPACGVCHTTRAVPFPGGGTMGPDLTLIYPRLGAPGLSSALETLFFPAMLPIYAYRPLTKEERSNLFAYFQSLAGEQQHSDTPAVVLIALAGLVILIGITALAGRNRLKPVRRRLIERARLRAGGRV